MTDAAAEIARLRAALAAAETRAEAQTTRAEMAERELGGARGLVSAAEAAIQHLRLEIAKLRRAQYGHRSERRAPRAADRPDRASAQGVRSRDFRGCDRRGEGGEDRQGDRLRAPPPGEEAVSRPPAARAGGDRGSGHLRLLWLGPNREAGRGYHRHARGHSAPVEGDPDRAREYQPGPAPFHATPRGWGQSMPSQSIVICAGVSATLPAPALGHGKWPRSSTL